MSTKSNIKEWVTGFFKNLPAAFLASGILSAIQKIKLKRYGKMTESKFWEYIKTLKDDKVNKFFRKLTDQIKKNIADLEESLTGDGGENNQSKTEAPLKSVLDRQREKTQKAKDRLAEIKRKRKRG